MLRERSALRLAQPRSNHAPNSSSNKNWRARGGICFCILRLCCYLFGCARFVNLLKKEKILYFSPKKENVLV